MGKLETLPVQRFYPPAVLAQHCTFIDGSGTTSPLLREKMADLREVMGQFEFGRNIVVNLQDEKIPLCFEDKLSAYQSGVADSLYMSKGNFFRISEATNTTPEKLMINLSHEWDHKNDHIDWGSFKLRPYEAGVLHRFSECGAFAFEATVMHQAVQNGVHADQAFPVDTIIGRIYAAYADTYAHGNNQEQAWRAAVDKCFMIPEIKDASMEHLTVKFREALRYPLAYSPDFATQGLTNAQIDDVVRPYGAAAGILGRTGRADVLSDPLYTSVTPAQQNALDAVNRDITSFKAQLPRMQ